MPLCKYMHQDIFSDSLNRISAKRGSKWCQNQLCGSWDTKVRPVLSWWEKRTQDFFKKTGISKFLFSFSSCSNKQSLSVPKSKWPFLAWKEDQNGARTYSVALGTPKLGQSCHGEKKRQDFFKKTGISKFVFFRPASTNRV